MGGWRYPSRLLHTAIKEKDARSIPRARRLQKEPGEYIAYAEVHESELFEPVFLEEDFTIKRAIPKMEISADRTEVKGGGRVNLRITVRNIMTVS